MEHIPHEFDVVYVIISVRTIQYKFHNPIERDGVSVNLQWPSNNYLYISSDVSTTPVVQPISVSMTRTTFTVAYNAFYNISIVATLRHRDDVCNRVRMALIPLHYSELTNTCIPHL